MMSNTDMLFNFPATTFTKTSHIFAQVAHIQTEADEAFRELATNDIDALSMEIMDCMHSCETALRILEARYGVDVKEIMIKVYNKNCERGYYL